MSTLAIIRAEEVVPGDVICFDEPDFDMRVQQTTRTRTGFIGLYAANSDWRVYRKADDAVQIRVKPAKTTGDVYLLEEEIIRAMDWQDRVVIWSSVITGAVCLALLVWGPK